MISEGKMFAERYRVEEFVGKGGMALVFRATDVRTGHSVAIKVLKAEFNNDAEFLERFQREAQAASLMNHHNIVNLLDVGVEDSDRYLVFEFIKGSTLRDIINQKKQLSVQSAVQITIRILSALQHAHQNHIIHRDIKPQNILINEDGLVKVSDFGIARIVNKVTVARDGMVVGSVHYSSPEQASGREVTPASDIYSAGVVLYEMLTGRVPFEGDNPVAVAMQHLQATVPPIENFAPDTPKAVIAVVMKALEKDPANRFATARDMADALKKAAEGRLDIKELMHSIKPPKGGNLFQKVEHQSQPKPKKIVNPKRAQITRTMLTASSVVLVLAAALVAILLIRGGQTISMPDLLNLNEAEARAQVEAAGLIWSSERKENETIASGNIINQQPGPEEAVYKGSTVLVTISAGNGEDHSVPNVTATSYDNSVQLLNEKGITNIVVVKTVDAQPVGTVLRQNPAAGSEITEGMSVELTVSGGSVSVPNLKNMTRTEAEAALENAGLTLGTGISYEAVSAELVGKVIAQSPEADSNVVLGISISITLGLESQPYSAELPLSVPASDQSDRSIKVVLVGQEGEHLKYQGTVFEGEALNTVIHLKSAVSGKVLCRIYLDDQLYQELTLDFTEDETQK